MILLCLAPCNFCAGLHLETQAVRHFLRYSMLIKRRLFFTIELGHYSLRAFRSRITKTMYWLIVATFPVARTVYRLLKEHVALGFLLPAFCGWMVMCVWVIDVEANAAQSVPDGKHIVMRLCAYSRFLFLCVLPFVSCYLLSGDVNVYEWSTSKLILRIIG